MWMFSPYDDVTVDMGVWMQATMDGTACELVGAEGG